MSSTKVSNITLVLFIVFMLWDRTAAQTACTTTLITLSPCLNYVSGNTSTPSRSCCTALSGVVQSQPQCLCALVNGGGSNFGMNINQTLALALPGACNVQTPPTSRCNGGPTASTPAPANSPSDSPTDDVPAEGPSDSSDPDTPGTGSRTGPDTNGDVGGSNISAKFSSVGILLLIASSWSFSGFGFCSFGGFYHVV